MADMDNGSGGGYGNPPEHSQFKPGQSGNPKGRPKGSRSLRKIWETVSNEKITLSENGETSKITKREAFVRRLFQKAIDGNPQAISKALEIDQKFEIVEQIVGRMHDPDALDAEDRAEIEAYMAERRLGDDSGLADDGEISGGDDDEA